MLCPGSLSGIRSLPPECLFEGFYLLLWGFLVFFPLFLCVIETRVSGRKLFHRLFLVSRLFTRSRSRTAYTGTAERGRAEAPLGRAYLTPPCSPPRLEWCGLAPPEQRGGQSEPSRGGGSAAGGGAAEGCGGGRRGSTTGPRGTLPSAGRARPAMAASGFDSWFKH